MKDSYRSVYLDHAAATPLDPRVREVMGPYLNEKFGNPSSFHMVGKVVRDAMEAAREQIADLFSSRPDEIIFTSGGTEANNLAILGFCRAIKEEVAEPHIITTAIEHPSVLEAFEQLRNREGFRVTILPVDAEGLIKPKDLESALTPETVFVSIMYANNEIGTIQPISELGRVVLNFRSTTSGDSRCWPVFHTDACQAAGALDLSVDKTHVDFLTINGSKIYGPKGVGALYVKRGLKIQPLAFGGAQERGRRPGTENVAGIIGLSEALRLAQKEKTIENERLIQLRDTTIAGLLERVPKTRLNGHSTQRLPNNVNISFMDVEGEAVILHLDAKGIYCSTGSACTSATLDPSHVILALGLPYEAAHGSIRFTLGRETTTDDVAYLLEVVPETIEWLRRISPVNVPKEFYG